VRCVLGMYICRYVRILMCFCMCLYVASVFYTLCLCLLPSSCCVLPCCPLYHYGNITK
jgi:hypothetical protein